MTVHDGSSQDTKSAIYAFSVPNDDQWAKAYASALVDIVFLTFFMTNAYETEGFLQFSASLSADGKDFVCFFYTNIQISGLDEEAIRQFGGSGPYEYTSEHEIRQFLGQWTQ